MGWEVVEVMEGRLSGLVGGGEDISESVVSPNSNALCWRYQAMNERRRLYG